MTREELLQTPEYWTTKAQLDLYFKVEEYMKKKGINRTELARELGVSKGYVSQILNGDFDHRLSKFVELSLDCGYKPVISFEPLKSIQENKIKNVEAFLEQTKTACKEFGVTFIAYTPKGNDFNFGESVSEEKNRQIA